VAIEDGRVAYEFPLPLGGLMSDLPIKQLARKDNGTQRIPLLQEG